MSATAFESQLYVSVDAATRDSLKAIDRPLFGDFWERFIVSDFSSFFFFSFFLVCNVT